MRRILGLILRRPARALLCASFRFVEVADRVKGRDALIYLTVWVIVWAVELEEDQAEAARPISPDKRRIQRDPEARYYPV